MQYRPHRYQTQFPAELLTSNGPQKGEVIDVNGRGERIAGLQHLRRGDKLQVEFLWTCDVFVLLRLLIYAAFPFEGQETFPAEG